MTPSPNDPRSLTSLERRFFNVLHRQLETPVSLNDIMSELYGSDDATSRVQKIVDVLVHHVRRKLVGTPWCIETTRGFRRLTTRPANHDTTQPKP